VVGIALVCAAFGLLVGSFLNVVIYRVPRGESVVRPPSHCPGCDRRLTARDLVPILSWLALRGRCRTCAAPISARYPAVEAVTGVLFGLLGARFAGSWALPAYLLFAAVLVVLSMIDLDTMTLPRRIVYLGAGAGAVLLTVASVAAGEPERLWWAAAGAAGALAFFLALHLASPRAMGFGDVRLAALIGLYLGWLGLREVPVGLFLGFLLGAVVGVVALVIGRAARKTQVPFGPFLAAGALVTVMAGQPIVALWLGG
jgi:leader peptidase (prepilin peptidase)/N-methyltransferase